MRSHWLLHIIGGFSTLGAFATWSRWCWLPNGLNDATKALGLHFFEGWLVFLILGAIAFVSWFSRHEIIHKSKLLIITGSGALVICLLFMIRTGFSEAANAAWISLIGASVAVFAGLIIFLQNRNSKRNKISCSH